jgi:hypothetical protein
MNVMSPVILARENGACMDRALRAARQAESVLVVIYPWSDYYLVQFSMDSVLSPLTQSYAVPVHVQDQLEAVFLEYREASGLPGHPWTYFSPTGSMQPVRPEDLDSYLHKMSAVYGSWDGRGQADVAAVLA